MGAANTAFSKIRYVSNDDAWESRLNLQINGVSYHFSASDEDLNEFNYGLGLGYDIGHFDIEGSIFDQTVLSVEGNIYSDSFSQFGAAIGVAAQKPLAGWLDLGLRAGLVHEQNLRDKVGSSVVPYLLPFAEAHVSAPLSVRLSIIPPLGSVTEGLLFAQMVIRFR